MRPTARTRLLVAAVLASAASACGAVTLTPGPSATRPSLPAPTPSAEDPIATTIAYGDHPDQVLDLSLPPRDGPYPVVVLVHGGFWREGYRRDLMTPLADDLVGAGYATVNVEYRRVGGAGGYPDTLADVAAAVDHLATLDDRLDLDRVAVVGHSAGGHLASWVGVRGALPPGAVGADPVVTPCAVVSQAGVNDLTRAAADGLGDGAVRDLLGGAPDDVPARYAVADPARLLPVPVPYLAVHGREDDLVPLDQSEGFVADQLAAGGEGEALVLDGDHFVLIEPSSDAWARTVAWIGRHCGS